MTARPAVIVNGLDDAVTALRASRGAPILLLSAPGAALFAGCLWWREVVRQARSIVPDMDATDVLDCADAGGLAASALRAGQLAIVLHPESPGYAAVVAIAADLGAAVLPSAPPALDLAERGAARRLEAWLHGGADRKLPPSPQTR
jgi:hypothetical protein